MKPTLFLHCGYPKTATTTLQTWVFPKLTGLSYLGRHYNGESQDLRDLWVALRHQVAESERIGERFNRGVSLLRAHRQASERDALLSAEGILGQCLVPLPRIFGTPQRASTLSEAFSHVRTLANAAGYDDVKIIVTLRRQEDLLSSFFAEAYMDRFSRIRDINTFSQYVDHLLTGGSLVSPNAADFCELELVLQNIFGHDGYRFILFDWLKSDVSLFAQSFAEFVGLPADAVAGLIAKSGKANVRRGSAPSEGLKVRRKNVAYFLDVAKKLVSPNRSLGIGRIVRPRLRALEYGSGRLVPQSPDLDRLRSKYATSNVCFVSSHPEFRGLVDSMVVQS